MAKAQLAMGHSIAVTPLQMVMAFAAFANGGNLYRPYLASAVTGADGDTLKTWQPQKIRNLVGADVVEQMGTILARVVTEGTAHPAQSEAIAIAGKTGTAHLDEPRTTHFGGWTAAPAFTRIAERLAVLHPELLRYPQSESLGYATQDVADPELRTGVVPNLVGLPLARAVDCALHCGVPTNISGCGTVTSQSPEPGTALRPGLSVTLRAEAKGANQTGWRRSG